MNQIRRVFNLLEQRLKGDNKNEKILERLDQYRAKEIDALWQRSAFLGTFLVLGYTGYGFLVDKIVSVPASNVLVGSELKAVLNISVPDTTTLHFLACALACVNMIFSVLWIAMAKGSKAWYEAYENAIQDMELKVDKSYSEVRKSICLKFAQKNDCLFSTKAGGYSPSKINITIGQISLVLWLLVLITHIVILCTDTYEIISKSTLVFLLFLIVWSTICVISNLNINKCNDWIESSYHSDKSDKN